MLNSPLRRILWNLADSIRLGHATNSSSSHSIIIVDPKDKSVLDDLPPPWSKVERPGSYGWEHFVARTKEEKFDYMWTMVFCNITNRHEPVINSNDLLHKHRCELTTVVMGKDPYGFNPYNSRSYEVSVDHDSYIFLGCEQSGYGSRTTVAVDFIRWLTDVICENDDIVIFGGNDNCDDEVPVNGNLVTGFAGRLAEFHVHDRKDHWLLYSPINGEKLRISKNIRVSSDEIRYSSTPELIDIKVTDFCNFGCAYCYQGSTTKGTHAKWSSSAIVQIIKELGCLEVAIGGGEPTDWHELSNLIRGLHMRGITANVTTRAPHKIDKTLFENGLMAVGYSVDNSKTLLSMLERLNAVEGSSDNFYASKLVIHVVLGTMPIPELIEIMKIAARFYITVLILGPKTEGRGSQYNFFPYDSWVTALNKQFTSAHGWWEGPQLAVDTAIVDKFGDQIKKKLKVNPKFMSPGEGNFSMYWDTVTNEFAKASYGDINRYSFKSADDALVVFNSWHQEENELSGG